RAVRADLAPRAERAGKTRALRKSGGTAAADAHSVRVRARAPRLPAPGEAGAVFAFSAVVVCGSAHNDTLDRFELYQLRGLRERVPQRCDRRGRFRVCRRPRALYRVR